MFTGTSGSRLLHPREFIESRNEADAMFCRDGGWMEACFTRETRRDGGEMEAFRGAAAGDAR